MAGQLGWVDRVYSIIYGIAYVLLFACRPV
jgi:hypothetical protein